MYKKKGKFSKLFIILIGLLIVTMACSLTSQSTNEPEVPVDTQSESQTQAVSQPVTEIPLGDGTEIDELKDVINTEALESYRSTMTYTTKDAAGITLDETTIFTEWNKEDKAKYIKVLDRSGGIIIEQLTIGETMWIHNTMMGDTWLSFPATMDFGQPQYPMQDFNFKNTVSDNETTIKFLGVGTINEVKCRHYSIETTKGLSNPTITGSGNVSTTSKTSGEIWIANESGLPKTMVRMIVDTETTTGSNPPEYITIELNVTDINGDVTIDPPK